MKLFPGPPEVRKVLQGSVSYACLVYPHLFAWNNIINNIIILPFLSVAVSPLFGSRAGKGTGWHEFQTMQVQICWCQVVEQVPDESYWQIFLSGGTFFCLWVPIMQKLVGTLHIGELCSFLSWVWWVQWDNKFRNQPGWSRKGAERQRDCI